MFLSIGRVQAMTVFDYPPPILSISFLYSAIASSHVGRGFLLMIVSSRKNPTTVSKFIYFRPHFLHEQHRRTFHYPTNPQPS